MPQPKLGSQMEWRTRSLDKRRREGEVRVLGGAQLTDSVFVDSELGDAVGEDGGAEVNEDHVDRGKCQRKKDVLHSTLGKLYLVFE